VDDRNEGAKAQRPKTEFAQNTERERERKERATLNRNQHAKQRERKREGETDRVTSGYAQNPNL
jgi:hypothetical protein